MARVTVKEIEDIVTAINDAVGIYDSEPNNLVEGQYHYVADSGAHKLDIKEGAGCSHVLFANTKAELAQKMHAFKSGIYIGLKLEGF